MRLSGRVVANAVAWVVVGLLVGVAVLVADRLGFAGLFLLGALTWLVCTRAALDNRIPVSSVEVFKAAMDQPRSPEARAAAATEHQAAVSSFRFYGWCGALLAFIGAVGFAWQMWRREPGN